MKCQNYIQMKNKFIILFIGICFSILFTTCEEDNNINIPSKVILDKLTTKGKIGDEITARVTFASDEINKLVVTKTIDGQEVADYRAEVSVTSASDKYEFVQMILAGDEKGTLVFTFSGYNAKDECLDASDLTVTVELSGTPLLLKYDWRLTRQSLDGDNGTTDAMTNNVYRFNDDYSWELDFGSDPTIGEILSQYCAWKIAGNESKIDSIYLVKFNFLAEVPTFEGYKVLKLEGEDLWIETTMDLSWAGYSKETKVEERYVAVPKSPNFSPYGNEPAENYNWGPCTPGEY